jgi:hypothetical protein
VVEVVEVVASLKHICYLRPSIRSNVVALHI